MENLKNFLFEKFQEFPIRTIPKNFNLENKLISKISKIINFLLLTNLQKNRISEIIQFEGSANFQNLTI